jgi:hypothetical protein
VRTVNGFRIRPGSFDQGHFQWKGGAGGQNAVNRTKSAEKMRWVESLVSPS